MSSQRQAQPKESWEFMFYARERVGAAQMQKIFSRGQTQINRYCLHPRCDDYQRNPLDRLRILFELLVEGGSAELVQYALNYLAETVGCRLHPLEHPLPDKETVEEECLDDFPELVEMDRMIAVEEHPRVVIAQSEKAKGEIDETIESYREFWAGKYGKTI